MYSLTIPSGAAPVFLPETAQVFKYQRIKATPHDPRLTPLHIICLPAFRHITQILLDLRQQACVEFRQSDENLD
ncbi:MAG: hypothetical protein IKP95_13125, partial [Ruminococcus sp.]|nr:hypothetical protein [Ruminococcus sp.]